MKLSLFFLSLLIFAATFYTAHGEQLSKKQQETANSLLNSVIAQLPAGWCASMSHDNGCVIQVMRVEPTKVRFITGNPSPENAQKTYMDFYRYWFTVVPLITQSDLNRMKSENEIIEKKIAVELSQIPFVRMPLGNEHILPNSQDTEKTKLAISEYNRLVDSLQHLPDYYYKDISIEMGNQLMSIADYKVQPECFAVEERLLNNFSKYK